MILAGPRGAGKYTLAVLLAQTANCLVRPETDGLPDACGTCTNCVRIGAAFDLDGRIEEATTTREEMRDADRRDTRILVQTHPDVLVIPPDPPQLLIKLGQVRTVIREIYRVPAEARRAFYIFTSAAFMKEAANSLLKVLEEPPAHASLVLLAENPGELLPTIRSRAALLRLGSVPLAEIERLLASRRSDWKPTQRALAARLAEGAVGRALHFPLENYLAARQDALLLLRTALREPDHSALFRTTETYRAGAEGQQKTQALLDAMCSLLRDLMLLHQGQADLIRNVDLDRELTSLAGEIMLPWIEAAERGIHQVESGMRRNLLRSLALDSFATTLSR